MSKFKEEFAKLVDTVTVENGYSVEDCLMAAALLDSFDIIGQKTAALVAEKLKIFTKKEPPNDEIDGPLAEELGG